MKKKLFLKFFVFAVIGSLLTFTSCKDYDDDIKNLQNQVTEIKKSVDAINAAIEGGAIIEGVTSTDEGVVIKTNKGEYKISNGKDGSTVTIGENGNWFIDAKDTGLAAKGKDGADGKDGVYYTPAEDGFWYVVEGDKKTKTDQKWLVASEGGLTAVLEDGSILLYGVEGVEGPVAIGAASINTLTLIPDFVGDKGGALPIIDFSPLVTECGDISPSVTVRYKVNKNASEASIDKDGIYFLYNNPTVRSSAINAKAEFVSLKDGVLTVKADINTAKLEGEDSNKIDQVMLVVPTTTGDEVHSDWAKVTAGAIDEIALVKDVVVVEGEEINWELQQLVATVAEAEELATDHVTVVDLAYDETLDLTKVINTMITTGAWADFDIAKYGLSYAFDLKDEEGKTIVYELGGNKTDQQKFINLVGSEISTRVYDLEGSNPAAIDRTPIVHVYLKSNDSAIKCNVLDGFIKINIVEAKDEPIPPVTFPVDGKVEAGCDDFVLKVGTKEMNENFYAAAKLSKIQFHTLYTWAQLADGVGTIEEVQDLEDTQSYNLVWTVTPAELAANVGKTITKSGTYTSGSNVIKVTFTAEVTQPVLDLGGILITNYWDSAKGFVKHNVATPAANDDNRANATFDTNINNAFQTNSDKLLDIADDYKYEYFFAPAVDQPVKTVDGITISVSANGKELLATKDAVTETVATILPQAADTGDILSYNEASELGKYLLNKAPEYMKARLYIKATLACNEAVEVKVKGLAGGDAFNVHFLRPVNMETTAPGHFVDAVDFGKEFSYIDIRDVLGLSDWRKLAKGSDAYNFEPDNLNYYGYYGIGQVEVDIDNIKTKGLKNDAGEDITSLPSTIEVKYVPNFPTAEGDVIQNALTYKNNGASLIENFSLLVPVSVKYKWGTITSTIEVLVKTTDSTRSAK